MRKTRTARKRKAQEPRRGRKAKRCKHHNTTSEFVEDMTAYRWTHCDNCNQLISVGPSNDGSSAIRLEMRAAKHLGDLAVSYLADVWDMGGGTLAFGESTFIPETWAWRIDRPIAEQLAETAADDAAADRIIAMDRRDGLDAMEYELTRNAEPDCRDEDGSEVERIMAEMES